MTIDEARWHGFRLTFNCAHHDLTDAQHWIGQLAVCNMCPLTTHNPRSPGVPVAPVRQIVAVDPAWAPQPPDSWGPEHWHGA